MALAKVILKMSAIIVLNYFIEYFTYYITIIPDGGGRGALVNGEAEVHPESGLSLFRGHITYSIYLIKNIFSIFHISNSLGNFI
jgi:hypothetical protein